ncbi:hypothetical protein E2C01_029256 [Portunus trituberculatus]|uniref:Uncharacterized protein n=1 Tax=Portunus trituberculatus TaxID=210409 RepID=A0A5B7ERR3_PORTR|nr:hypothetical protein [Portunus trituberculatus]
MNSPRHAAPFDSTESVEPALGFLESKLRSRLQPVNTTPLESTVGSTITQHFTTAIPHKYHFPSSRVFHIASIQD